ncbi:BEM_collapsed_G0045580.mRNA.1.CDS.1 [Saccharomyces cerevisiae]|nr:BEM_collapsed_G0045580.mRNA.1.CDS.1 [Saccharomyces cerevisiae]
MYPDGYNRHDSFPDIQGGEEFQNWMRPVLEFNGKKGNLLDSVLTLAVEIHFLGIVYLIGAIFVLPWH